MKLGIMQPYLFPYVGYFQLIYAVDKFVVYDDVSYIKQGWINRNRILLNCKDHIFTVPLKNASSYQNINDTEINMNLYADWKKKFLKTITQSYAKAPYYSTVWALLNRVFDKEVTNISELATASITEVCAYLGINTPFEHTSAIYNNNELKAAERVIDICKTETATIYINPIGGKELYNKEVFKETGLDLFFIKSKPVTYAQFNCEFVPWLSIIDLLMFLPEEKILEYIQSYELV